MRLQKQGATRAPVHLCSSSERIRLEAGDRMVEVALELGPGLGTLRTSHRAASTEHAA